MTNLAVSVAGLQTLGAPMSLDVARESRRARLRVGLGRGGERRRGDVAARRDQPGRAARRPRHRRARAAAAHAAAARDGRARRCSSSPATATCSSASASRRRPSPGQWHGAGYTDRPLAQVREFVALLRECLSGETVSFDGDFYHVSRFRLGVRLGEREAEDRPRRAERADAAPRRRDRRRRAAQLPARVARAVVRRAGPQGRRRRDLRVRALRRDRPRPLRRRSRARTSSTTRSSTRTRTSSRAPASPTTSKSSARGGRRRTATARSPRSATRGSTASRSWATPTHVRAAVQEYADNGVDMPIVFALPWGEDRRATVSATLATRLRRAEPYSAAR